MGSFSFLIQEKTKLSIFQPKNVSMNKIIRYLTKDKLNWLLSDNGIYVGAAKDQSDREEGIYNHGAIFGSIFLPTNSPQIDQEKFGDLNEGLMQNARTHTYLSSWYWGDNERADMWKEYGFEGVLIVSSEFNLRRFLPTPLEHAVRFYRLSYDDRLKEMSMNRPFMVKGAQYRHENEFRLEFDLHEYAQKTGYLIGEKFPQVYIDGIPAQKHPSFRSGISLDSIKNASKALNSKGSGYVLKYNLHSLIDEIRLHPQCTKGEEDGFRKILLDRGLDVPLNRSRLEICRKDDVEH